MFRRFLVRVGIISDTFIFDVHGASFGTMRDRGRPHRIVILGGGNEQTINRACCPLVHRATNPRTLIFTNIQFLKSQHDGGQPQISTNFAVNAHDVVLQALPQ